MGSYMGPYGPIYGPIWAPTRIGPPEKDEVCAKWVEFKQSNAKSMTEEELKGKASEATAVTQSLVETFKKFARECLAEFRA